MTEITYLFHDGFMISTPTAVLIFDFWKIPDTFYSKKCKADGTIPFLKASDSHKPIYVFVSHHHKDHFSKEIFNWCGYSNKPRFIISRDTAKMGRKFFTPESIYKGSKADPDYVFILAPGDTVEFPELKIKAYGSTDTGNSYLINTAFGKIFHAGDLNAWIWKDESTPEEVKEATDAFSKILDEIAEENNSIDFAMFPVDARIGSDFYTGAKMFLERINVSYFFPMHFELWNNDEEKWLYREGARDFEKYADPSYGDCILLSAPGDTFACKEK